MNLGWIELNRTEQNRTGDDFEPLVVTQLQKELSMIDQRRVTSSIESNPKRNNYVTPNNQRTQKCKPTSSKVSSKWNDYIIEDNEHLELGWKRGFNLEEHSGPWNNSVLEAITSERQREINIENNVMSYSRDDDKYKRFAYFMSRKRRIYSNYLEKGDVRPVIHLSLRNKVKARFGLGGTSVKPDGLLGRFARSDRLNLT
ncbi:hypothetical protein CR513_62735, partial [Mucuna pruriens]